MSTVLFVANRSFALTNSRKSLIESLVAAGNHVVVCAAKDSHSSMSSIPGVEFHETPFYRGGASLFKDLNVFFVILCVFLRHRPSMVHAFNAKPVIFVGILLRFLFKKTASISVITGLGHAFIHGRALRRISGIGYRFALKRPGNHTVFQNSDDFSLFKKEGWVNEESALVIVGSGVDVHRFSIRCLTDRVEKQVLMIGRLINQKGVGEFIEAATLLRQKYLINARFVLIGERDSVHPDAVDFSKIQGAMDGGVIDYLGFQDDVVPYIQDSDVFVLPSYREGVPRTVLEAASCGVPCVGANVPGIRECIIDGETGFLVEVSNVQELAERVKELLENDQLRRSMSKASRLFMEKSFDISSITKQYLCLYRNIGVLHV